MQKETYRTCFEKRLEEGIRQHLARACRINSEDKRRAAEVTVMTRQDFLVVDSNSRYIECWQGFFASLSDSRGVAGIHSCQR